MSSTQADAEIRSGDSAASVPPSPRSSSETVIQTDGDSADGLTLSDNNTPHTPRASRNGGNEPSSVSSRQSTDSNASTMSHALEPISRTDLMKQFKESDMNDVLLAGIVKNIKLAQNDEDAYRAAYSHLFQFFNDKADIMREQDFAFMAFAVETFILRSQTNVVASWTFLNEMKANWTSRQKAMCVLGFAYQFQFVAHPKCPVDSIHYVIWHIMRIMHEDSDIYVHLFEYINEHSHVNEQPLRVVLKHTVIFFNAYTPFADNGTRCAMACFAGLMQQL